MLSPARREARVKDLVANVHSILDVLLVQPLMPDHQLMEIVRRIHYAAMAKGLGVQEYAAAREW